MGTVAAPLLAGFAVTFVTLTVQDPDKFRYPSLVLLAGTCATLALLISLQCSFAAQRYAVTPNDLSSYYAQLPRDIFRTQWAYEKVRREWSHRAVIAYNIGLLAFMLAVGLLLVPRTSSAIGVSMPGVRWVAVAVAAFGLAGEIAWWILNGRAGKQTSKRWIDELFPTVHGVLIALDRQEER